MAFTRTLARAAIPTCSSMPTLQSCAAVVITLPDPRAAERTVRAVRSQSDHVPIVVRSRYHRHIESLEPAGASAVVDEEKEVGDLLGQRLLGMVTARSEEKDSAGRDVGGCRFVSR